MFSKEKSSSLNGVYKDRANVLKYLENGKNTDGFREEAQYEEKYRTELEYYKRVKKELRDG